MQVLIHKCLFPVSLTALNTSLLYTDDLPLNSRLIYPTCLLSIFVGMFNRLEKLIQNQIPDISFKNSAPPHLPYLNKLWFHPFSCSSLNFGVILSCHLFFSLTFNSSASPVGSTFKIFSKSNHLSPSSQLITWTNLPSLLTGWHGLLTSHAPHPHTILNTTNS